MALISLFLTVLSVFTFWLVVPLFILPPLAAYVGYRYYRQQSQHHRPVSGFRRLLCLMPMLLAIVAFLLELYIFNTEYRV